MKHIAILLGLSFAALAQQQEQPTPPGSTATNWRVLNGRDKLTGRPYRFLVLEADAPTTETDSLRHNKDGATPVFAITCTGEGNKAPGVFGSSTKAGWIKSQLIVPFPPGQSQLLGRPMHSELDGRPQQRVFMNVDGKIRVHTWNIASDFKRFYVDLKATRELLGGHQVRIEFFDYTEHTHVAVFSPSGLSPATIQNACGDFRRIWLNDIEKEGDLSEGIDSPTPPNPSRPSLTPPNPAPGPIPLTNDGIDSTPGPLTYKNAQDGWKYSDNTDAMGRRRWQASLTATNHLEFRPPYGSRLPSLVFQSEGQGTAKDAYIQIEGNQFSNQFFCIRGCTVNVRFDGGPICQFHANTPAGGKNNVLFLEPASVGEFLAQVRKAKRVRIEAQFFREGPQIADFATSGFR